ncbi:MAG: hypothetical protein A2X02_06105 [Bacteroidetes bacterium GWF2_29_10]|nr:MAG: hypothetical protein A2X02_06105 [Bacteroidetes bacterium GWF2_29_10]
MILNKYFISILFILFTFLSQKNFGQGNILYIENFIPSSFNVCDSSQEMIISIYNPSPFVLSNVKLTVNIPNGIVYEKYSVQGAVQDNNDSLNPTFKLADIYSFDYIEIKIKLQTNCELMYLISEGKILAIKSIIDYKTSNGFKTFDRKTSYIPLVRYPYLAITDLLNQTYSGDIGDNFDRCFNIKNAGYGSLKEFIIEIEHGEGLQQIAINHGKIISNANGKIQIQIDKNDLKTIGNNNDLFENGEIINICEKIKINKCESVKSNYNIYWGCNMQYCQNNIVTGNVIFPAYTPNLNFKVINELNKCLGKDNDNIQQIIIKNNGLGAALDIKMSIFMHRGQTYFVSSTGSWIEKDNIYIENNGIKKKLDIDSYLENDKHCVDKEIAGLVNITIPKISGNDSVILSFNLRNCCYDEFGGNRYIGSWRFYGEYKNLCNEKYDIPHTLGRNFSSVSLEVLNNDNNNILKNNETKTVDYLLYYITNGYPGDNTKSYEFKITFPEEIKYKGNLQILRSNGINKWLPSNIIIDGNIITAIFKGNAPWNLRQSSFIFDIEGNCNNKSNSNSEVKLEVYYKTSDSCACKVAINEYFRKFTVLCNTDNEGFCILDSKYKRKNYGLPDNDNDGIADNVGNINENIVKTNRMMFGDTLVSTIIGKINTKSKSSGYKYIIPNINLENGTNLTYIGAILTIFRKNQIFTIEKPFKYYYSSDSSYYNLEIYFDFDYVMQKYSLNDSLFADEDSIIIKTSYIYNKTKYEAGNCNIKDKVFVANDLLKKNISSDSLLSFVYLLSYYYYMGSAGAYYYNYNCDKLILKKPFYFSAGPCCTNYNGGNLFPYEYRQWTRLKTVSMVPPKGYIFDSANVNQIRTAGTILSYTSPWISITPIDISADTLKFDLTNIYTDKGGIIYPSDDGFSGNIEIKFIPTCEVEKDTFTPVYYKFDYEDSDNLKSSDMKPFVESLNNTMDYVNYSSPSIFLQSFLPLINPNDSTLEWLVSINNNSLFDINQVKIFFSENNNIKITNVTDKNGLQYNLQSDNYIIGELKSNELINLVVKGVNHSCEPQQIDMFAYYNCFEDENNNKCKLSKQTLAVTPQMPYLITNIDFQKDSVELCKSTRFHVKGRNIQLGKAYNIKLRVIMPNGTKIIPNSSFLAFKDTSLFNLIPNPKNISGTIWEWNLSEIDTLLAKNGLNGLTDTLLNSIRIYFDVIADCGYISGSYMAFMFFGESSCGLVTSREVTLSTSFDINGAIQPYNTEIDVITEPITPCDNKNNKIKIKILNKGNAATGALDSVSIIIPEGMFFVSNSITGLHNCDSILIPNKTNYNNQELISIKIPENIVPNDSMVFEFMITADKSSISCGNYNIVVSTNISENEFCALINNICYYKISTGYVQKPLYVYTSFIFIEDVQKKASNDSTINLNYKIINKGSDLYKENKLKISYLFDANGNNEIDTSDKLIKSFIISQNINLFDSINIIDSIKNSDIHKYCNILITVEDSFFNCICNNYVAVVPINNTINQDEYYVCQYDTINIGINNTGNFSYKWTPYEFLDDSSNSNTNFHFNSSLLYDSLNLQYILETNKNFCNTYDSINIKILTSPQFELTTDTSICQKDSLKINLNKEYKYIWSDGQTDSSIFIASPTTNITYTVSIYNYNNCIIKKNISVNVNNIPYSGLDSLYEICFNDTIKLEINNVKTAIWNNIDTSNIIKFKVTKDTLLMVNLFNENCFCEEYIKVKVKKLPQVNVLGNNNFSYCQKDSINIKIETDADSLIFNDNKLLENSINLIAEQTAILLINAYKENCIALQSIPIVVYNLPIVNAGIDKKICSGDSILLKAYGAEKYLWSTGDTIQQIIITTTKDTTLIVLGENTWGCKNKDSININVDYPFIFNITQDSIKICKNNDAIINVSGVFSHLEWSNGSNDSILTITPLSSHYLYVTASYLSCKAYDSIFIEVIDNFQYDYLIENPKCYNDSSGKITIITQEQNPKYYLYINSDTIIVYKDSFSISLKDGINYIKITNNNTCVDSFAATISKPSPPEIKSYTNDITCAERCNGKYSFNSTPYWKAYYNNVLINKNYIDSLCKGIYSVDFIDTNGCKMSEQFEILSPNPVSFNFEINEKPTCNNNCNGIINIKTTGGTPPYIYLWDDGYNESTRYNSCAKKYIVSVYDNNACFIVDSLDLTPEIYQIFDLKTIKEPECNKCNGTILIKNYNTNYIYTVNNKQTYDSVITNLCVDNYTITEFSNTGCQYSKSIKLNDTSNLAINIIVLSNDDCIDSCDKILIAQATGGLKPYKFIWNNSINNDTIYKACAGKYNLKTIDDNECIKEQNITIDKYTPIRIQITTNNNKCINECQGSIEIKTNGGKQPYYIFINENISNSTFIDNLCQGEYSIKIIDSKNCKIETNTNIKTLSIGGLPNFNKTYSKNYGENIIVNIPKTNIKDIQWISNNEINIENAYNPIIYNNNNNYYTFLYKDSFNCYYYDSIFVEVLQNECNEPYIFIPNSFTPNNDNQNDLFFVRGNIIKEFRIVIFDRWGEQVFESTNQNLGWDGKYKNKPVHTGIYSYFVEIKCFDGQSFFKKGNISILR